MFPGGEGGGEGIAEAVVVPLLDEVIVLLEEGRLPFDGLPFLRGALAQVHLIAEGAAHGHGTPGLQGGDAAVLLIGRDGDVGPHGADGIAEGGAVLDAQAVHGVGVVAAPDLGGVVEHPCVKPAAAAGAALDQQLRVVPAQPLQNVVDAKHIAVVDLPLAVGGQGGGPDVGEAPVHIPFEIGDAGAVQDLLHGPVDVIPDLPTGEVQHQLAPAPGLGPAGNAQGPVGMLLVKQAVLTDHLRLDPEAKAHAQGLNAGNQGLQPAGQLVEVHRPVPQAAEIGVPGAEPAVVHDKELDAETLGAFGDLHQLVGGEVEFGGLPLVDEHRVPPPRQGVPEQVLPDGPVELAAHLPQAAGGADQSGRRGGEGLPRGQGEAEVVGVDAQHQPVVF